MGYKYKPYLRLDLINPWSRYLHTTYVTKFFSEVVRNPWTGLPMPPFLDNDIAILELEEELDLMEYTPICLAGKDVKESGD